MGPIVITQLIGFFEDKRANEYKGMIDIQQISAITIDTVHITSNVVW